MNLAGVRQEIVDKLSTVEGVTGYLKPPSALRSGDAWPIPRTWEAVTSVHFITTWQVYVLMDKDPVIAQENVDDLLPDLVDALRRVLSIQTIALVPWGSEARPAIEITGIRE